MSAALKGRPKSAAMKAALSAATKGRKNGPLSEATKAKMRIAQQARFAKPEEHAKLRAAQNQRFQDPKEREKLAQAQRERTDNRATPAMLAHVAHLADLKRGTHLSAETKAKMSAGAPATKTTAHRDAIRKANRGNLKVASSSRRSWLRLTVQERAHRLHRLHSSPVIDSYPHRMLRVLLWTQDLHLCREVPVLGRSVDLVLDKYPRLLIEVDGFWHETVAGQRRDAEKDAIATRAGYTTLRVKPKALLNDPIGTLGQILRLISQPLSGQTHRLSPPSIAPTESPHA